MKTPFLFALLCFTLCTVSLSAQSESACDEIFEVAAPMPVAQGCENKVPRSLQIECTKSAIKEHVENRLVMPIALKKRRTEIVSKTCNFRFVIDQEGQVSIVKSEECPDFWKFSVELASKDMPPLTPGGYNGKTQCVALDLSISFRNTVFSDIVSESFIEALGALPAVPESRVYEEVFKVVEDMPRFYHPDCETLRTKEERKKCAAEVMLDVIYSNLVYPVEPRVLGIEETVVVSFWVEKTGKLTHINAVRGKREDFKAEAVRLVEEYLKDGWVPGKQRGKPVVVQFNLPIKFELNK